MAGNINEIKTRIALKQGTYEYWTTDAGKDITPLYGEVCFCEIPAADSEKPNNGSAEATNPPTVLFKVGDGTHKFADLKWASALAADVYDWAKKSESEFIEWVQTLIEIPSTDWNDIPNKPNLVNSITAGNDGVVVEPKNGDVIVSHGQLVGDVEEFSYLGGSGFYDGCYVAAIKGDEFGHVGFVEYGSLPSISIKHDQGQEAFDNDEIWVVSGLTVDKQDGHILELTNELAATTKGVQSAIGEYEKFGVDNTTVNALGGIAAGTNLKDKTLHEILEALLLPYVAPAIAQPTRIPSTTSAIEMGKDQTITGVAVTVTKKSKPITKVAIYLSGSNELIAEKSGDDPVKNGSTSLVKDGGSISFENLSIAVPSTNVTIYAKAWDEQGTEVTSTKTANWSFVYPYYYGICAEDKTPSTLTAEDIKAMTKDVRAKGEKSYTYTTDIDGVGHKMVIAYPTAYGTLKKALDSNGFDYLAEGYEYDSLSITGEDGSAQTYYVYAQKNASYVTNFVMKYQY